MSNAQRNDNDTQKGPKLTYYDVLAIPRDAKEAEVRKAYLRKAAQCHPDKNPDDPLAKETFQAVAEAYECLSKPAERAAYDRKLASANLPPPRPYRPDHAGFHTAPRRYPDFPFPRPPHPHVRPHTYPHHPFNPPYQHQAFDYDLGGHRPETGDARRWQGHGRGHGQRYKTDDPYAGAGFRPTYAYTAPEDDWAHGGGVDGRAGGAWDRRYGGAERERARYGGAERERARYAGEGYAGGRDGGDSRGTTPGSPEPVDGGDTVNEAQDERDEPEDQEADEEGGEEGAEEEGYRYKPLPRTRPGPHAHSLPRPPFPGPFVLHNILRATFVTPPFAPPRPHGSHHPHRPHSSHNPHPHLKPFDPASAFPFPIPPFAEIERMLRDLGVDSTARAHARGRQADMRSRARADHAGQESRFGLHTRAVPGQYIPHMRPAHNSAIRPPLLVPAMPPIPSINSLPMPPMQHTAAIPPPHLNQRPVPIFPFIPPPPSSGLRCPPPSAVQSHFGPNGGASAPNTANEARPPYRPHQCEVIHQGSQRAERGQPDVRQASWEFVSPDGICEE